MKKRRAFVIPMITLVIMTALAAIAPAAYADGGDFSIDFIAAGPFTYDHDSGVGGEYADRTISKTEGVVESLEGGDFDCGDKVVYFAAVTVAADATGEQDIELDVGFLAEPTGQPGVGHSDLISASPNTGDSGMSGDTGDTTASIVPGTEEIDTSGSSDELVATIAINDLDPGEVFILRMVTELDCIFDSDPTGNLQAEIKAARVVAPAEDVISVGNQTIPFKSLSAISQPGSVSVSVGGCPAPGSPTVPVTVTIAPAGSATITILGPGGPYVVTGSGDTLDLEPGSYTWSAVAERGFILTGDTSGGFTVQECPLLPATISIEVGVCPAPGSATVPVTITIDPSLSATVTIEGPGGPYVVTGDGDTLDLSPGDYTWTADAAPTYELDVDSGEFTVSECPGDDDDDEDASVTVVVGPCPVPGSPTVPVTVTIDPPGSAEVVIEHENGTTWEVDGGGAVLNLPPGDYTWEADDTSGFDLDDYSGEFSVQPCPAILASVNVTVGACPATSSETMPVAVAISPDGAADVTVTGPNGFNAVVTSTGATLDLAPGTYNWSAGANPTFELVGASEGTFVVGSCGVEVLPKTVLPKTGTDLPGIGAFGFALFLLGVGMVTLSRRPASAGSSRFAVVSRLSGRSDGASMYAPAWVLHACIRSSGDRGAWSPHRGYEGRHGS